MSKELIVQSDIDVAKGILDKSDAAYKSAAAATEKVVVKDENTKDRAFKLRDQINAVSKQYKEARMPFTRKLDEIRKLFTASENRFDELVKKIDTELDGYAKEVYKAEQLRIAEEQKKLNAVKERQNIEQYLVDLVAGFIKEIDVRLNAALAKVETKEDGDKFAAQLKNNPIWTSGMEEQYFNSQMYDKAVFKEIADKNYADLKAEYVDSCRKMYKLISDMIPVKLQDKEEAARLLAAEKERKKKEEKEKEATLDASKQAELALAQLDADPVDTSVKVKKKIEIVTNEGWLQVISLWYKHDPDARNKDLSRKTFMQCLKYCEKLANSDDIFIEHDSVKYIDDVKATK